MFGTRLVLTVIYILTSFQASGSAEQGNDGTATLTSKPMYTPLSIVRPDGTNATSTAIGVEPIPDRLRAEYRLDPFYKKYTIILGMPIIGSDNVSNYAFLECAWTLDHLLHGRTKACDALVNSKVRVGIIAVTEYTMDIPENQDPWMTARAAYNDRRSRGLGGLPLTTCAEENLLNLPSDHYDRENITIHEFSHTVASAIRRLDPGWYERLRQAYEAAKTKGIYGSSYAITDEQEYWAEGAQCWFDCANPRNAGGASNRDELKAKDQALAALLTEVYGDGAWRYVKTMNRSADALPDITHLAGLDRSKMPVFDFNKSPRIQAEAKQSDGPPGSQVRHRPDAVDRDKSGEANAAATTPPQTNPDSVLSNGAAIGK